MKLLAVLLLVETVFGADSNPDVMRKLNVPACYLAILLHVFCLKLTFGSEMAIQRQDHNRVALFHEVKRGQVLSGHVVVTHQVRSNMECLHRCISLTQCVSFNSGLQASNSRQICELNSASRNLTGHVFEARDGFSYYEPVPMTLLQQRYVFESQSKRSVVENTVHAAVESSATPSMMSSVSSPRSSLSLLTSPSSSFLMTSVLMSRQLSTCPLMSSAPIASSAPSVMASIHPPASSDNFLSSSAVQQDGYAFLFSRKGVSDYVIVHGIPSLTALTACFWMRSNDTGNAGTPLSHAVDGQDNEFTFIRYNSFRFIVGNIVRDTNVTGIGGKWHHICSTWKNTTGTWKFYKDGKLQSFGQELNKGHVIHGGGALVLGQDQDSLGGGFNENQSFIGELTGVNIWSCVLDDQEIATLSESCLAGEGDVFKWSDFKNHTRGGVQLIDPSCAA